MSNTIWVPPKFLAWSVFKSPEMATIVQKAVSGKTTRAQLYADPIWNYKFNWELLRDNDGPPSSLDTLVDFFLSRAGSFDTFLYSDTDDSSVVDQLLGYGDGVTTQFQLVRQFLGGGFYETIQNPSVVTNVKVAGSPLAAFTYAIGTENLLLRSQNFTNAAWSIVHNATILDNQTTAPDGTATAGQFTQSGTAGSWISQVVQASALGVRTGDQLTLSCYMKQNTAGFKVQLVFDFLNSSNTSIQTVSEPLQTLTSSFVRYSFSAPVPIGATQVMVSILVPAGQNANGNSFFMWGAQLERWALASGYLATLDSIVQPNGLVTLASAPGVGQTVTSTFSFYYRLRFKNDLNEFEQFMSKLWSLQQLEMVSERR